MEYFKYNGKTLSDDLKTAGWNIDNVSGYGSRSLIRAGVAKEVLMVLLNYIKREGGHTTYKRRAKKLLNDAGFYHLSELARARGVHKQTLDGQLDKYPDAYIIELEGRRFYKLQEGINIKAKIE
jgi:hypothetical protein